MKNEKSIAVWLIVIVIALGALYMLFGTTDTSKKTDQSMTAGDVALTDEQEDMNQNDDMTKEDSAMVMEDSKKMMDEEMSADSDDMMQKSGKYIPYDQSKLAMANDGNVVLFFKASWCPSCRALDSDIKNNLEAIPAGVTILEVDYDSAIELKKKYGVTTQHTLVQVDADGNQIKKWAGSSSLEKVLEKLN